ncbi:MAG: glycosyltransferase family 4 protein [Dolichospermum sp.]|jgi:glycosyltransferase involved in cell wall biosynthesis
MSYSSQLDIAFVTPYLPLPLNDGAKLRDYNILIRLAQYANVHLISYLHSSDDVSLVDNLKDVCSSVHLVNHTYWRDRSKLRNILRFGNSLCFFQPVTIFEFSSDLLNQTLQECIIKHNIQVVHASKLQMVKCLRNLPNNVVRVLDEHNIESEAWKSKYLMAENSVQDRLIAYLQGSLTKRIEFNLQKYADIIFTVSEHDQRLLKQGIKSSETKHIVCARQSVDTKFFNPDATEPLNIDIPGKHIVFIGSMSYAPNVDAVLFFVLNIFPLIKARSEQSFTFWVVGKQPSDNIKELAINNQDIIVTGSVPDVRPYLKMADIAIAPIRFGGGTKTKILEALSMKLPTVISCHSSEGIDNCGQDTSPFIVSTDDPILFADSVIRLSNLKSVVGEFARNFVTNNYSWDVTANTILKEYEASLTRKLAGFTKNI